MMATSSNQFRYSEFITASHKKRRKHKPHSPAEALQRVLSEFDNSESAWFTQAKCPILDALAARQITSPAVVCLGLGSPSSSRDAIAQLGFLLQLCHCCNISPEKVSLYDPVFTEADKELFVAYQFDVLSENRNGDYPAEGPTLFFMPHCDLSLYENILRANWTPQRLEHLVLVANNLSDYIQNKSQRELEEHAPCLLRTVPILVSHTIPASISWPTAFNNTSVQFVPREAIPESTWFTELAKVTVTSGKGDIPSAA
ncbi:hypothetical protein EYR40_001095 [Pleurotus pulmonarius]|nr:hypothetical protein EYR38_004337 [Pleurotus pulmonarius]KAF4608748.1 hypothetical protein EYR40_001095 [Pleurotus pulmonarius]